MSVSIDYAFVVAVDRNVQHLAQVTESAFRGTVRTKPVTGKAFDANRLGLVEMAQKTNRHAATYIANPDHTKRRGQILDYEVGVLIDEEDELKTLISPQSEYAIALAYARNRRFDNTVITAFNANAMTVAPSGASESVNANGGVLSSFTGFDGTAAVNHTIANGTTGLTVAKVRQVKRLLDLQQTPQSGRHFVTSSYGMEDLLADPQVTSSDFNTLRAMESGTIRAMWMGFTWHFSDLLAISSNIQPNFAWHESAMVVGEGAIKELSIDKRPDLSNAIQVLAKCSHGAVRVEEAKVVQVDIDTTA